MHREGILTRLFFLSVAILLLPAHTAYGAGSLRELPTQPLTIENAIAYALEHNTALLAARQDVNAIGQQVKQAKADFLPKLDSGYRFTRLMDQPYMIVTGTNTPSGESIFPTADKTSNRWELDLIQPLFTGFGLTAQLNISKLNRKIGEYKLEETRLDVVRNVQRAFLDILLGEKIVQVAKENVSSLEVHRRNAESNFQQGVAARNDVLKADVALSQAIQRERSAAKQLVILRSHLNQILDLDLRTVLTLAEQEVRFRPLPSIDSLYTLAEKQRPEYLALETAIRQAEESVRAAKSRYYPHVSAFAQYYREGYDFLAEHNEYTNNENAAVGIRVDWNLFEGGKTDAAVKEWQYRRDALEQRRQGLLQDIRIQVEDAFEQMQLAKINLDTAEAAVKQAEENERMTSIQYKESLVIFLEVLNAQVVLSQSRIDYLQALYGYQLAWADLERAIGGTGDVVRGS